MDDTYRVEVGKQGRVVIPAEVRRELGLEEGTELGLIIEDGAILLMTDETAERQLHEMFAGDDRSLSEELLAERRAEAVRDAAESQNAG